MKWFEVDTELQEEVKSRGLFFSALVLCLLLDSMFVVVWAIIHTGSHKLITILYPDPTVIPARVFQWLSYVFDASTLFTVGAYLFKDLRKVWRRLLEEVKSGARNALLETGQGQMNEEAREKEKLSVSQG